MTLHDEDRSTLIKICMEKAQIIFDTAVTISKTTDYDSAANRAYYSMFYCENALLLTKGIEGDTHKHVHNSISQEFVKTSELPKDTYTKIMSVQEIRNTGDYSKESFVSKEEMEKTISAAKDFLDITQKLIAQFQAEQEASLSKQVSNGQIPTRQKES